MSRPSARHASVGARGFALLCLLLTPAAGTTRDLPPQFSLARYVPEDVWFYVHQADNPQRQWINATWADVFQAVKDSGIVGDLASILLSSMEPDQATEAHDRIDLATKLVNAVDWSALTRHEYLFAERIAECCIGYEYIFLARGAEGSGKANFTALGAIQDEIAALGGTTVLERKVRGVPVRSVRFEKGDLKRLGFSIELFHKGDLIGVVTGRKALTDVLALASGEDSVARLTASKRFTQAVGNVPPPRDAITFFDVRRFVGDLGAMFDKIARRRGDKPAPQQDRNGAIVAARDEQANTTPPMSAIRKVLREVDIVDFTISTTATEGIKEWTRSYTRLRDHAPDRRLAKAFFDRAPFAPFDQYVPANAVSFSATPMLDLEQLYKTVTGVLAEIEPELAAKVARAEARLGEAGFDLQADLFDWLSGEILSIELPAAMATPLTQTDSVLMVRVKDSELASKKVGRGIDRLAELSQGEGQMLMVTPAPVEAEGFRQVTHPLVAMILRPVIGVHGDWLFVGTSADAINACLAVAAGKAPSIAANERFQREGLTPKGPVRAVSFKDISRRGQELAGVLTMVGTFGSMAVAGMPEDDADARKAKQIVQKLLKIAMKAGPILQRINFYSSEAMITIYDDERGLRCERLVTYKKPASSAPVPQPLKKKGESPEPSN